MLFGMSIPNNMNMKKLNRWRASYFIALRCKEIQHDVRALARKKNFAGVLQTIVNQLQMLHAKGEVARGRRYIHHLAYIYDRGNAYVQYMIENLFIRSLRSLKRKSSADEWTTCYKQLPKSFVAIYDRQLDDDWKH